MSVAVTVTVTVYVPAVVYVWVAVAPGWGPTVVPSPNVYVYVLIGALPELEADALAVTANGTVPDVGVIDNTAVGATGVAANARL